MILSRISSVANAAIAASAFPGGVLVSGTSNGIDLTLEFGHHTYDINSPKTQITNYFDLASLTKIVSTTPAIMFLLHNKDISLNDHVGHYLPDNWFHNQPDKKHICIIDLLAHCSGMPADCKPEVLNGLSALEAWHVIQNIAPAYPRSTQTIYSDIGFILLGKIIEEVSQTSLDVFVEKNIFSAFGMYESCYLPLQHKPNIELFNIVPTEFAICGELIHGVVHDECCRALGGIAGHAGLFSTANDLAAYASYWLDDDTIAPEWLQCQRECFMRQANLVPGSTRALGWDTKLFKNDIPLLKSFDDVGFGHTGFVGNSLWISKKYQRYVILLTNQVYPTRETTDLQTKQYWRQTLHATLLANIDQI